jgi:hypothetical protein
MGDAYVVDQHVRTVWRQLFNDVNGTAASKASLFGDLQSARLRVAAFNEHGMSEKDVVNRPSSPHGPPPWIPQTHR